MVVYTSPHLSDHINFYKLQCGSLDSNLNIQQFNFELNVDCANKCTAVFAGPKVKSQGTNKRGSDRADVVCHAHNMAANFKLVQDLWHITLLIYMHDNACTNADAQTHTNKCSCHVASHKIRKNGRNLCDPEVSSVL